MVVQACISQASCQEALLLLTNYSQVCAIILAFCSFDGKIELGCRESEKMSNVCIT
jgi:hypothetical protein